MAASTYSPHLPLAKPARRSNALARFAWFVLVFNVGVILWGAYVRATGSGAGCGNHWPLCGGEVIPRAPQVQTLIEFTHRLSSGLALVLVAVLFGWTWLATERRSWLRWAAGISLLLILNEAILGALLVLLQHVAQDRSLARAAFLAAHFANTLLLLASLCLTAMWLAIGPPLRDTFSREHLFPVGAGLLAVLVIGVTGSWAALGDTLFPDASIAQDFAAGSQILLRLRLLHPVMAAGGALYVLWQLVTGIRAESTVLRNLSRAAIGLLSLQIAMGILNVTLRAPVWLQMLHLLGADLLWCLLIATAEQTLRGGSSV